MGKQQQQQQQQGRSKLSLYAIPCLCLTLLGLLILAFQAGPLIQLIWAHHLQNLAASAPLLSTFSFPSTGHKIQHVTAAAAHSCMPSLLNFEAGPCTCSLRIAVDPFNANEISPQHMVDCTCPSSSNNRIRNTTELAGTVIAKEPCAPQKPLVKVEEPWYVKGRSWHPPPRFPRCTMDACFNYTRCEISDELLIYTYNKPAEPARFFKRINESKYNTNDPNKACLFFVFLDTPGLYRSPLHPSQLPYWQGGLNHVLITFRDKWHNKGPAPESIGYASAMATVMHESIYRPGFDVSIPLPAKWHFPKLRNTKAFDRKYLMTFRGLRYLENEGVLRSFTEFRQMHNGDDVIVVTSCRHPNHRNLRRDNATLDEQCQKDEAVHDKYDFSDLMNTTFGLAPAGRQPNSYRFAEILSAGAVPVLIADNYVKPYDKLVQWHRCILQFPSTEIHRILKTVRAMKREEVERRQKYCLQVYNRWFAEDDALFEASMEAQKTRFMGAFPSWPSVSYID